LGAGVITTGGGAKRGGIGNGRFDINTGVGFDGSVIGAGRGAGAAAAGVIAGAGAGIGAGRGAGAVSGAGGDGGAALGPAGAA